MQSELIHAHIRRLAKETGIKVFTFAEVSYGAATASSLCHLSACRAHAMTAVGCAGCSSKWRVCALSTRRQSQVLYT